MENATLIDLVRKCVTRDYYTPNVTAETTIGCLLTPRLAQIVNAQCGLHVSYVAKEMSLPYAKERSDNRGCKIDFVLADDERVYLTELKTTPSSISEGQLEHYEAVCGQWTFGESMGKRLLKILSKEFSNGRVTEKMCNDGAFARLFKEIVGREPEAGGNAEAAQECVRTMEYAWRSWDRSKKYLLTLGEILDYLGNGRKSLWDKPMKIIYLAPGKPALKAESPHIQCLPTLEGAIAPLAEMGDAYSLMLAEILKGITKSDSKGSPFGPRLPLLDRS